MSKPTTISSKGQVTVPWDVRERLGLQAGDKMGASQPLQSQAQGDGRRIHRDAGGPGHRMRA